MFIILGTKPRKVKVDGGLKREKYCSKCGRTQIFEEVRWINHFSLFLFPFFQSRAASLLSRSWLAQNAIAHM
jgi:hypothetical protein